ncbi:hypothetical protein CONPUDRAFT_166644 [Coniophora puteana RWD-64-598 SS2]|uniref:Uncharacterized protein n=1 Tax=Coniophora puteana (strain RWD-64-598) TaxID=741705 RepID=A0A5M3MLP3_CONPW|nr:uncharacterized protein CONPUDRAFT_166644 [Coniophora puteana RWD-64-598 SS2]EIW80023.1 hypothetical protein CONPUDRAFT_166644 [Coniophora puteana RWD-64-598 SS2]
MSDLSPQHSSPSQAGDSSENPAVAPSLVQHFLAYPFSTDQVYQQGLSAILTDDILAGKSDAEKAELRRRAELFYFNRNFGTSLTLEDIQAHEAAVASARNHISPAAGFDGTTAASTGSEASAQQVGSEPHQHQGGPEGRDTGEERALTFAELKALIEEGKTDGIPNNKVIPDVIHEGAPSQSSAPVRKKPWE